MNIRFRKIKLKRGTDAYALKVDIVRSKDDPKDLRVSGISKMGTYKVRKWRHVERGYFERELFWKKAEEVFKRLNLAPDDETKLRRELETTIPKPPPLPAKGQKYSATWQRRRVTETVTIYDPDDYEGK